MSGFVGIKRGKVNLPAIESGMYHPGQGVFHENGKNDECRSLSTDKRTSGLFPKLLKTLVT